MSKDRFKAPALVLIQMLSIVLILITGWPLAGSVGLLAIQSAGLALGIWAIFTMGAKNTSVSPLIKGGARLVTGGPYALIRHPMYASVLLIVWPLIVNHYSVLRLTAGLVLTADLFVKMRYEEGLLRKRFAGYEDYMKTTKRLIPFVL